MVSNALPQSLVDRINAELAQADAQVVAKLGPFAWTRGELQALFSAVANRENWKAAIDAEVVFADDRAKIGTFQAIEFFTGSRATMTVLGEGRYRVVAAGYYAAIGA